MLKTVAIALFVVLAGLVMVVSLQPADFRVVRTAEIAAPPERVFALVNDFHQWEHWSPWAKLDPAMKTTYEGSASGIGAIYKWAGNDDVGEGQMTITGSRPPAGINIKLDFLKPFASTNTTQFTFTPSGTGTSVEWAMWGQNDFLGKAFCLFMGGMDRMIGPDFEKGLAQMKAAAESSKPPA